MDPDRKDLLRAGLVTCVLMGLSLPIVLSFFGSYHQVLDSFTHLRFHLGGALAVVSLAILLATRHRLEAVVGLALGLAAIATTAGSMLLPLVSPATAEHLPGDDDQANYRLLHVNLRYDNPEPQKALSLIGQLKPDVITLAEVSEAWQPRLELLKAAYPYRIICHVDRHIGGVAILSRRPFAPGGEPRCVLDGSLARASVLFGDRPVGIAALHLGWPWPMGHHWHIGKLQPEFETLGDDAILAGDFNAVDWSDAVRRVVDYTGMRLLGGIGPTWLHRALPKGLRPYIGLPIDHAMVKGDIRIRSAHPGGDAGSDHLPIVVDFSLLPKEPGVMSAAVVYR